MKTTFWLFLAAALWCSMPPSWAQSAELHPDLLRQVQENKLETIRIGLYLHEQIDATSLRYEMATLGYTAQERAKRVIKEAYALQARSQKPLLERLQNRYPALELVHAYWIANVLLVEVPLKLVTELQQEAGIAFIFADQSYLTELIEPVSAVPLPDAPEVPGGREPGLDNINAPALWAMGYTGRGRKAFTVDTGTWTEHPALKHRFLGTYKPLNQGWFSLESRFPVDRPSHHGTHVNGTILGLDTATNDTIGAAFNAYFMASNPLTHSNLTPLSINLLSFEWAMNPDGDTSTVDDIPDVINNSWGQAGAADTSICWSWATQIFDMVEAAGVAITFSAGNEGPGPSTVKHPQFNISNQVNIFSIGAINANVANLPIAGFSSTGPTLCIPQNWQQGDTSLLIKPEVVAPGVNVRSAFGKTGYGSLSGTSMACPHVSGAVVLLKEAFPQLGGDSILYALYRSAIDMGAPGEDNVFGMGRIDVLAAYNRLAQHHQPVPAQNSGYDLAIRALVLPPAEVKCINDFPNGLSLQAELWNAGDSALQQASIQYRSNGGSWQQSNFSGNLLPGQRQLLSLSGLPVQAGWNDIEVRAMLPAGLTDRDIINNHRSVQTFFTPTDTLLLNGNPGVYHLRADQYVADSTVRIINRDNDEITWDTISVGGLSRDSKAFVMRHANYGVRQRQHDDLLTNQYTGGCALGICFEEVSFKLAYRNRNTAFRDSLRVTLECDCGNQVQTLYYSGGDSMRTYNSANPPSDSSHWRSFRFVVPLLNQSCFVRFRTINDFGGNLFLGDLKIQAVNPTSLNEVSQQRVQVYPNPFKDELRLSTTSGNEVRRWILRDVQGRQLYSGSALLEEATLQLNGLAPGMYLLELHLPQGIETKRLVKQ